MHKLGKFVGRFCEVRKLHLHFLLGYFTSQSFFPIHTDLSLHFLLLFDEKVLFVFFTMA